MLDDRSSGPCATTRFDVPHGLENADACPDCRITAAEFLHRLPPNVVDELPSRTTTRDVAAGDVLCAAGDAARALYILRVGRMKLRLGGRIVKICRAGEILGGGAVAAALSHTVDFIALDDCHLELIPLASTRFRGSIVSAIAACGVSAHRPHGVQAIVFSVKTIARLVHLLAEVGSFTGEATNDGLRVPLTLSHKQIGRILALPESAVTDIFEELEARGVLYTDRTGVTILKSGRPSHRGGGQH